MLHSAASASDRLDALQLRRIHAVILDEDAIGPRRQQQLDLVLQIETACAVARRVGDFQDSDVERDDLAVLDLLSRRTRFSRG